MKIDDVMKEAAETYIRLNRSFVEDFLAEIKKEGYTTISEVQGSLYNTLDALRLAEFQSEEMTSERYHEEASADHLTSEQL